MSDSSKAVLQSGRSKMHSSLVKAFQQWTTPYDVEPEGVFGSVATITSGQVSISSESLDVDFTVPFDDDMEPNEADITVYNLSANTIAQLKENAVITIEAGYKGDTGELFKGYIKKVATTFDGADKVTTIKALDDIKKHKVESLAFDGGVHASHILRTLIGMTGIPVAVFKIRRDHYYKDGQTVDGDLMQNIKKYAQVCGISVYVNKGNIYARHIKEGDNLNFELSADTGLIGSPSPYTEEITAEDYTDIVDGYEVKMLLQHRVSAGGIVGLKSRLVNGTYRVCSGTHRFSQGEATTTAKMY